MKSTKNILVILGMHRSGTSLTSDWLEKCGLNLGDDLLGGNEFNPRGHFEDIDVLKFHNELLDKYNLPFIPDQIDFKPTFFDFKKARKILRSKIQGHGNWAWKDPRTCLFLNVWKKSLPIDTKFLVIYRDPLTCVDSLLRRLKAKSPDKVQRHIGMDLNQKEISQIESNEKLINYLLKAWYIHNNGLIKLIDETTTDNLIVFENTQLADCSEKIFNRISIEWGFNLESFDPQKIIDPKLMQSEPQFDKSKINQSILTECMKSYDYLRSKSQFS